MSSSVAVVAAGRPSSSTGLAARPWSESSRAAAIMLRRTSESDPVLMWRHSLRRPFLRLSVLTRLPLCASVMPNGLFT